MTRPHPRRRRGALPRRHGRTGRRSRLGAGRTTGQSRQAIAVIWVAMAPGAAIGSLIPAGAAWTDTAAMELCQRLAGSPLDWTAHAGGGYRAGSARAGWWTITPMGLAAPGTPGQDYEKECVIQLASGATIRTDTYEANLAGSSYVRVCGPAGREIGCWTLPEWREDPQDVMAAILGAAAGMEADGRC